MKEDEVKSVLKEFFEKQAIETKQEVKIGKNYIDFLIEREGKKVGVEAKSDNSNEFATLGQILNYYKYLSHIFLAAPTPFLTRFLNLLKGNAELETTLNKIGIINIYNDVITIQKEAENTRYYFNPQSEAVAREHIPLKTKFIELDVIDEKIIELVRGNKTHMLQDMSKSLGMKVETLRKRIRNLEQYGYVKIISKTPTVVALGGDGN
jgi:uncharacterized membrane protein